MSKHTLAICLALAFVAGAAAATLAQGTIAGTYWYSGTDLMSWPRIVRAAYAAGAHDMFAAIIKLITDTDAATAADTLLAADACLDRRSAGRLGDFTDWAESLWRGRLEPAAKVLLLEACR